MSVQDKRFLLHAKAGLLFCLATLLAIELPTTKVAIVGSFGSFGKGPLDLAPEVNASEFLHHFQSNSPENFPAEIQDLQIFRNGGDILSIVCIDPKQPPVTALEARYQTFSSSRQSLRRKIERV